MGKTIPPAGMRTLLTVPIRWMSSKIPDVKSGLDPYRISNP
jgi:hypothetical protein